MLNFSTGIRNLVSGCGSATVKTVYSSRKFIEQAKFQDMVAAIEAAGVKVRYLEDLGAEMGVGTKLWGLLAAAMPRLAYHWCAGNGTRTARRWCCSPPVPRAPRRAWC